MTFFLVEEPGCTCLGWSTNRTQVRLSFNLSLSLSVSLSLSLSPSLSFSLSLYSSSLQTSAVGRWPCRTISVRRKDAVLHIHGFLFILRFMLLRKLLYIAQGETKTPNMIGCLTANFSFLCALIIRSKNWFWKKDLPWSYMCARGICRQNDFDMFHCGELWEAVKLYTCFPCRCYGLF